MHATSKTQETHFEHVDEQLDAFEISIFDAADKFLHCQVPHGFVSAQQYVDTLHKPGKKSVVTLQVQRVAILQQDQLVHDNLPTTSTHSHNNILTRVCAQHHTE